MRIARQHRARIEQAHIVARGQVGCGRFQAVRRHAGRLRQSGCCDAVRAGRFEQRQQIGAGDPAFSACHDGTMRLS
ncbi:hypothetical protein D3C72_1875690 [compost metagenome]